MQQYKGTAEELKHLPVDLYDAVMRTVDNEFAESKPIINVQVDSKWLIVWRTEDPNAYEPVEGDYVPEPEYPQ